MLYYLYNITYAIWNMQPALCDRIIFTILCAMYKSDMICVCTHYGICNNIYIIFYAMCKKGLLCVQYAIVICNMTYAKWKMWG